MEAAIAVLLFFLCHKALDSHPCLLFITECVTDAEQIYRLRIPTLLTAGLCQVAIWFGK